MPSALTSPVLDNVPTTLDKSQMDIPATKPATNAAQVSDAPSSKGTEEKSVNQATNEKRPGPALRQRFSVLFTEQRPFLLYAENASISYLMPNALVEHPWISHMLRGTLENRALEIWQALRKQQGNQETARKANGRPQLTISGRVEDRFSSDTFSSLFLKETRKEGAIEKPDQILSFNFDHRSEKAFGLRDLFSSQKDDALKATIDLIGAYMEADIVRQKSISPWNASQH